MRGDTFEVVCVLAVCSFASLPSCLGIQFLSRNIHCFLCKNSDNFSFFYVILLLYTLDLLLLPFLLFPVCCLQNM